MAVEFDLLAHLRLGDMSTEVQVEWGKDPTTLLDTLRNPERLLQLSETILVTLVLNILLVRSAMITRVVRLLESCPVTTWKFRLTINISGRSCCHTSLGRESERCNRKI